jgi:hypothetical protein
VKNYYTDKPVLQYRKTTIEMGAVVGYLQSLPVLSEVKRAAYIMFRVESANGRSGINENYIGAQADSGRWPAMFDCKIIGTVVKNENGTGKQRIFLAFSSWKDSIDFLVERVENRGLYIGGYARLVAKMDIAYPEELCLAYKRDWVTGNKKYLPTEAETKSFLSMYRQAEKIFS